MKKTLLLAGALCAAGLTLSPTSAQAQGIRLGVKGGGNLSNLAGDLRNQDAYNNKFGFHAGVMANISLLPDGFLSVQPEVLFSQKGFQYDDASFTNNGATYQYEGDRTYNYLDVPVLLKVKAGGLFFEAGPQYSYLLKVKDDSRFAVDGAAATGFTRTQNLADVNRHEIGYAAGLGYESPAGLLLGLRYNGSFTDFGKDGYQDSDVRNARNSVFQASVGFLLPGH